MKRFGSGSALLLIQTKRRKKTSQAPAPNRPTEVKLIRYSLSDDFIPFGNWFTNQKAELSRVN